MVMKLLVVVVNLVLLVLLYFQLLWKIVDLKNVKYVFLEGFNQNLVNLIVIHVLLVIINQMKVLIIVKFVLLVHSVHQNLSLNLRYVFLVLILKKVHQPVQVVQLARFNQMK